MIQSIISRLAGFSANAKNFCITVAAAISGISFQQRVPSLLLAAGFVVVVFAALDVYYLAQERRFRTHYKGVADRSLSDARKLDLDPAKLTLGQYLSAVRSFSTGGFYLLLLIVMALILPIAHERAVEAGLGNFSRPAGASESERVGGPINVAPRPSIHGPRETTSNIVSIRQRELVEPRSNPTGVAEPVRDSTLNASSND